MGTTVIERFQARVVVNSASIVSRYDSFFILLFEYVNTRETFKMINNSSYRTWKQRRRSRSRLKSRGKTDGDLVPPSSCNQMELLSFLINLSSLIKGMLFSPHDASILVAAKGCALCNNYALYVNFTSISPLGSCAATIKDDGFETRPRVMAIIKQSGIWRKARNISRCFSPRDWSWKKELFRENVRSIYMCNDFYSASTRDAM